LSRETVAAKRRRVVLVEFKSKLKNLKKAELFYIDKKRVPYGVLSFWFEFCIKTTKSRALKGKYRQNPVF
jgi:hypothetical protein